MGVARPWVGLQLGPPIVELPLGLPLWPPLCLGLPLWLGLG